MGSIQSIKAAMGYSSAMQRPACRSCMHAKEEREDRMPPFDTARWHCKKGGFMTTAGACCNEYQDKRAKAPKESSHA